MLNSFLFSKGWMEGQTLASFMSCELEAATIWCYRLFRYKNRVITCLALSRQLNTHLQINIFSYTQNELCWAHKSPTLMVIKGTSALVQPSFIFNPQTPQIFSSWQETNNFCSNPDFFVFTLMQHLKYPSGHFPLSRCFSFRKCTTPDQYRSDDVKGNSGCLEHSECLQTDASSDRWPWMQHRCWVTLTGNTTANTEYRVVNDVDLVAVETVAVGVDAGNAAVHLPQLPPHRYPPIYCDQEPPFNLFYGDKNQHCD